MHPMRLTNKQIQEIVTELRGQLKRNKSTSGELNISVKIPMQEKREKAKLVFTMPAWKKMISLIDECSKEIAWHGLVIKENNIYTVKDILVFPQTVTGATVTSDETEYSMWLTSQPDQVFNEIRFHGHSHVNMGVSPSGVDTEYQENMLRNVNDFYIFAIFNKKGDHWCAIFDVESNVVYDNKDVELVTPNTGNTAWAKQQIAEFVKEPKPVTPSYGKPVKKKEPKKSYTDSVLEDMDDDEKDSFGYSYYGYLGGMYGPQ